jgi:hypothetical protein
VTRLGREECIERSRGDRRGPRAGRRASCPRRAKRKGTFLGERSVELIAIGGGGRPGSSRLRRAAARPRALGYAVNAGAQFAESFFASRHFISSSTLRPDRSPKLERSVGLNLAPPEHRPIPDSFRSPAWCNSISNPLGGDRPRRGNRHRHRSHRAGRSRRRDRKAERVQTWS